MCKTSEVNREGSVWECVRNCQQVWIEGIDQSGELASLLVTCLSNEDGGGARMREHHGLLLQRPHKPEDLEYFRVLNREVSGLWVSAPTSALASSCWHLILTRQFSSSLIKCCCHSLKSLQKFVLPERPVRARRPWGGSLVYHQDEKCLFIFPPLTQKWMKCGARMCGTNNSPCSLGLG